MRTILLLLLILLAGTAAAQQPENPAPDDRITRLDRAQRLHNEAAAIREESDRHHLAAQTECWKKFLVNACLDDARKAHMEETVKARALDKEAREIEREVKRQDIAAREAKRMEEAPAKEASAAARAEKNRKAAEEAQLKVEHKQAEAAAGQQH
jgi:colicin import membrane protein